MCASQYETAFSFMNLGISCLRLKDYDSAEKVLTKANIQDISNSNAETIDFNALIPDIIYRSSPDVILSINY